MVERWNECTNAIHLLNIIDHNIRRYIDYTDSSETEQNGVSCGIVVWSIPPCVGNQEYE